ncbi:M20 family metallopeptidase [Truepera radiovictrix]|uniref:Probable succinyl-diaminopimelate desuccinylase n=1 Tax=Truepera radiovictrix (strain DSM 17093 / CIP 108686 / LMG 22925 / RQ-24) TaxID=649638 RepID=D7CUA6_TRURR|nr:M20 family metallopeptidase [Truepera radiovictrix]ADI15691.1 acetylornithine deacetylase or succinyl-diaminopimelate desuccinylase [Truepera radiovictrix DSM 17093]WMT58681.1 M20 family metallopeptidase [Truepera radiovictrix]
MTPCEALAARAAAAVDPERAVALARALVQRRSVFEPERGCAEAEAARFLAATLRESGFSVTLEEVAPGRPNVIADWSGSRFDPKRHKTLLFGGHTDVVTEGDAAAWKHPPFAGVLEGGRLYGRGACDMKAGVAAAVVAAEAVRAAAPELGGRLRLGFVVDEEGLMLGVKHFIRRGWARGVAGAIICEPEENELCLWQKGALRVEVRARGVMAHGAMPYAGVNPVPPLVRFLGAVGELEHDEQRRLGAHPFLGLPYLTPTILRAPERGEAQLNVLPETALCALDIRTVPGQDHRALLGRLGALAEQVQGDAALSLTLLEDRPWTQTPADDPLVRALEAAYVHVFGTPPRYGGVPGATDGTFLHAWAGVPVVTVGPGGRTVPHQRDEYVAVDDLVQAARLYAAAAVYFLA